MSTNDNQAKHGKFSSCHGCPAFKKSFINCLKTNQINALKEYSIQIVFNKGQRIISRHNELLGIYCIRSGFVKYHLTTPLGDSATIGIRSAGDTLGHNEFLQEGAIFSITCITDVEVCFFPNKVIKHKIDHIQILSKRLLLNVKTDLDEMANFLFTICFKTVRQRVIFAIFYVKQKTSLSKEVGQTMILSRKEFAEIVCSSRESVYRELIFLQRKRYISIQGLVLVIENEENLRTLLSR